MTEDNVTMQINRSPLISVIIPIYNAEKYLNECLSSILNQTYKNLEIICINDGSSDGSNKICNNWAKSDSRIKIIQKINEGVGAARNIGIRYATGELISFIDSDDYIDNDFYEYLINIINSYKSDIAYCAFRRIDINGNILTGAATNKSEIEIFSKEKALINMLRAQKGFSVYVWNAIYKKNLIPYFSTKQAVGEDQSFTVNAILNSTKIAFGSKAKYNYRINPAGSRSIDIFKRIQYQYETLTIIENLLTKHNVNQDIFNAYYERRLRMELGLIDGYSNNNEKDSQVFKKLQNSLIFDSKRAYKGIKGIILSKLFSVKEPIYRIIFRLIKKLSRW